MRQYFERYNWKRIMKTSFSQRTSKKYSHFVKKHKYGPVSQIISENNTHYNQDCMVHSNGKNYSKTWRKTLNSVVKRSNVTFYKDLQQ